jgi:predicted DNA-binding transcriptional regulator YafY
MRTASLHDRGGLPGSAPLPASRFPLARLLQLIGLLQTERCPNARQIAETCEVSRRTIYRDFATLSSAGITVLYRPDRQGYQLARNLFLHPLRLEEKEALALLVLARKWGPADDLGLARHANQAVDRLLQCLPEELRARLVNAAEVLSGSTEGPHHPPERRAIHDSILAALGLRRQIRLWVRESPGAELETTKLAIYRLTLIRGRWCLVGRSTRHCRVMLFPVAQIERVELTADPYSTPPRFNLARFLAPHQHGPESIRVTMVQLRFQSEAVPKIKTTAWPSEPQVVRSGNGAVELALETENAQALLPTLLSFGDEVEVLEPRELRAAMSDLALRIAQRHGPSPCPEASSTPIGANPDDQPLSLGD